MTYDGNGNIVEIKDSNDIVIQKAVYDFNNNPVEITDALNNTVSYTYDGLGNVLTYTTARNNTYTYNYDGNGRVVKVTDPLEGVAESIFDSRGNQTGLTDQNGNQTTYSYDLLNRLVSETTADGFSDSYAYDNLGALTSYTNKRGQTITYTYDSDGRRTSRVTAEGTTTYTYDNNNNVLTITDETGTITRTYDSLNRVTSYTNTNGDTIGYEYDNNGNLSKLIYPDGKAVSYGYNANNQMTTVTDWNNRVTTYDYDDNGRLISENRPNNTIQTYTYNVNGQLISTTDKKLDGSIINKYDYEYDADGNIVTEDSINEPNYDNITIPSSEMGYGSANRLIDFNGTVISYDNDGNMLNTPLGNKWGELTYNSQNLLTDVVTSDGAISFEYDAENNRTLKTEYGKTTSYVVNPNAELSQVLMSTTNGETTYYIYGLGLITEESNNGYKTYHYDYRGSTTAITDTNGNVTDRVYYAPYGNIINRVGETDTPFLYVGKYGVKTDDNGLYYMRARYYNPQIQCFINVDPIKDDLNWYGYVSANPINFVDYLGTTRVADGKYNYETQIEIINYSVEYNKAKRNNDKKGMEEAQKKADALRVKSNEPWFIDIWGREQAGYFNMATIAVFDVADRYFEKNSLEYGEFITNSLVSFTKSYINTNNEYNIDMLMVFLSEAKIAAQNSSQCFTEETLIKTENGHKKIADIKVGDKVLSENEKTGEIGYKEVKQVFVNETGILVHIYTFAGEIKSTESHPFYVANQGWTFAKKLKSGDIFKLANGETIQIESIETEILEKPIKVYNFEVEDWHTYFVGKDSILVHNMCKLNWINHGYKHFPNKKISWSENVKSTKNGPAKYSFEIHNIEKFEQDAWSTGTPVNNEKNWRVKKYDSIIGASEGKETNYVRIENSANTIHGHPITENEYNKLMR